MNLHSIVSSYLNVKELFAQNRRNISSLTDSNGMVESSLMSKFIAGSYLISVTYKITKLQKLFDQLIKSDMRKCNNIWKIGQRDECSLLTKLLLFQRSL